MNANATKPAATLSGPLDFAHVTSCLARTLPLLRSTEDVVALDLSGVEHCDSAGLALLLEIKRQVERRGKRLGLLHPPTQMLALATFFGVHTVLPFVAPQELLTLPRAP